MSPLQSLLSWSTLIFVLQFRIYDNYAFASRVKSILFLCGVVAAVSDPAGLDLLAVLKLPVTVISVTKHIIKYLWEGDAECFGVVSSSESFIEVVDHSSISSDSFSWNAAPTKDSIRHALTWVI